VRERLGHRPALDGLRGVAILLVVVAHAFDRRYAFFAGGALGVDLFFVLSGFLITTLLLEEWYAERGVSVRRFYVRRARRLLPALTVLVLAAAALEATRSTPSTVIEHAVVRMSYLVNFFGAMDPSAVGPAFMHLWSLGLEEQFYLVWPLLLVALLRLRARPRHLLWVLGCTVLFINLDRLAQVPTGDWRRLNYLPDTHGDVIIIGCIAAIIWSRRPVAISRKATLLAALVMAVMIAWFRETSTVYLLPIPLFALAAAVVLLAVMQPGSAAERVLRFPFLQGTGRVSYSLYLWHVPLIAALGPVGGVAAAIPAALLSYRYVEQPFRRKKVRQPRADIPAAALAVDRAAALAIDRG
jgi:peptidoglycan/LPS O-acetylase OafA/YrhL